MPASLEKETLAVATMPAPHINTPGGPVQRIDPLTDPGWDAGLRDFPAAGIFHTRAWARVLQATYGYTPRYYVLKTGERWQAVLPLMEVDSWLTGRRGVALPFTDDCEPLGDGAALHTLFEAALEDARARHWKYLELRGGKRHFPAAPAATAYWGHRINLNVPEENLFANLESGVRRAIRKAEDHKVSIEIARDLNATRIFYRLQCLTRQRHGVPPQTLGFFENIQRQILEQNRGLIVIGRYQGQPAAAAMFFQFGRNAIFKYGASDERFQQTRANNLVMWAAIQWHVRNGGGQLSLGRTALSNDGLRRFKRSWGSEEHRIEYLKYDRQPGAFVTARDEKPGWQNRVLQHTPVSIARVLGAVLYKHMA